MNVSYVIPAHNEVDNIRPLLEGCLAELERIPGDHEILIVDDGSTDGTTELLEEMKRSEPLLRTLRNRPGENVGCHPAELQGFAEARGDALMFLPADLQILPDVLPTFLGAAERADVVASHRVSRADPAFRRFMARANNWVERRLMGVDVHDAHSSMLITRRAADQLVPKVRSNSAVIPAELLVRASMAGLPIAEVEIEHHPRVAGRAAGAKPTEVLKVQLDMFRLRRALRRELRENNGSNHLS